MRLGDADSLRQLLAEARVTAAVMAAAVERLRMVADAAETTLREAQQLTTRRRNPSQPREAALATPSLLATGRPRRPFCPGLGTGPLLYRRGARVAPRPRLLERLLAAKRN
jgi:hypothetical protein